MCSPLASRLPPCLLVLVVFVIANGKYRVAAQDLPTLSVSTNNAIPVASEPASSTDSAEQDPTSVQLPALTTQADQSSETTDLANVPNLDQNSNLPTLTGLPTLPGGFDYPAPSVPPTAKAPYMQHSSLPDGFIFIAVGATLGFVALVIIAWRGLVAWSINRSVRRSASQGYNAVGESSYDKSDKHSSGFYNFPAPLGSTMSLDRLSASNRPGTSGIKAPHENSNLFFSPTAGAGMHAPGNRSSGYLPSGYYSSSTASIGGGAGTTTVGAAAGAAAGDRGSKLRPHSWMHTQTRPSDIHGGSASPPDSPDGGARPSTAGFSSRESRSSLNLSATTGNRTPSTYLDDLVSNAPPLAPQGRPSGRRRRSSQAGGRH
jgi:hypothetical protein